MYRPFLMSALLVLATMAGCFGGGDEETDPSRSTRASPGTDPEEAYKVIIRNYTDKAGPGVPVNVSWEVQPVLEDDNQSITVPHTAIHWGNQSVPNPYTGEEPVSTISGTPTSTISPTGTTPTDPGMAPMTSHTSAATTTATTAPTTATSATGGTTGTNGTGSQSGGARAYPNETDPQSGVAPGFFNESFMVNESGLIYIRAHAIIGNKSFWSDEYIVNVTANATMPAGKTHVVTISGTPGGPLATFNPKALPIKVGDAVVWKNQDNSPVSSSHTATSTAGTPGFDTGLLASGATSKPVYFNATGSWTYRCNQHQQTMTGNTITVT